MNKKQLLHYIKMIILMIMITICISSTKLLETYNGDVIDRCVMVEQKSSTVQVIALAGHVKRSQSVFGFRCYACTSFQQYVDHLIVATPGCTVQRGQAILQNI